MVFGRKAALLSFQRFAFFFLSPSEQKEGRDQGSAPKPGGQFRDQRRNQEVDKYGINGNNGWGIDHSQPEAIISAATDAQVNSLL